MVTDEKQNDFQAHDASIQRVLTSRQKRNKKHDEEYSRDFGTSPSPGDKNAYDLMALTDFMMHDTVLDKQRNHMDNGQQQQEGYLETERMGDDVDEYINPG